MRRQACCSFALRARGINECRTFRVEGVKENTVQGNWDPNWTSSKMRHYFFVSSSFMGFFFTSRLKTVLLACQSGHMIRYAMLLAVDIKCFGSNSDGGVFDHLVAYLLILPWQRLWVQWPEPANNAAVADQTRPTNPYIIPPHLGHHLQRDL